MTLQVQRSYVKYPADFPADERRRLNQELLHARSALSASKTSGYGLKHAQTRVDRALTARSISIKNFVDRVNTHTSLVVRQDGDKTRRLVQEDGEKTRAPINRIIALASGQLPPEELQSATLQDMDAAVALMQPLRSKLRRAENKKRKAVDAETAPPTEGTSSSSKDPLQKATRAKVRAPVDFSQVRIVPNDELPADVELGPHFETLDQSTKQEIEASFKLQQLPPTLLSIVVDFVNANMRRFRIHKVARKQSDLDERPKLVFAVPHPDHGGFGLYTWGQAMEDYGRVEEPPEVIRRLLDHMSNLYEEEFNHCMMTLHNNGNCGIPPHPDKSFSKESKGKNETASKLADISLGATRAFMLVPNSLDSNDSVENMEAQAVATLRMTHGTSLCMQASWNTLVKHCVPLDASVTAPRISMVFRRVDRRFIHPTENLERYAGSKEWKPLVNTKKEPVILRRQDV